MAVQQEQDIAVGGRLLQLLGGLLRRLHRLLVDRNDDIARLDPERGGRAVARNLCHDGALDILRDAELAPQALINRRKLQAEARRARGGPLLLAGRLRAALGDSLLRNSALLLLATVELAAGGFLFWQLVAHLFTPAEVGRAVRRTTGSLAVGGEDFGATGTRLSGGADVTFDCVGLGFNVVIPRDAIAGSPADYRDVVIKNSLSLFAKICTTDELIDAWSAS